MPAIDAWTGNLTRETRCLPAGEPGFVWAVPLWSENGLAGVFFLGEKTGGGRYSEEEIELAQAAGERLLDLQAGAEVARLSLELLRQRVAQARVLEGQSRRVLHDEVLPELHTSALELSGLAASHPEVLQAVENLSAAHRRISDLLRSVAQQPGAPGLLSQQGLVAALRALVEGDLAGEFDRVEWLVDGPAEERARAMQPFAAEVIYFAARELLRNAARYARGRDSGRPVAICLSLQQAGQHLRLAIEDDGVGMGGEPLAGGGSGLRLHSAMLAAVGASLAIGPRPGGGTRAVIESAVS
jgi:signal transduction histidine kinase